MNIATEIILYREDNIGDAEIMTQASRMAHSYCTDQEYPIKFWSAICIREEVQTNTGGHGCPQQAYELL